MLHYDHMIGLWPEDPEWPDPFGNDPYDLTG
jgi:hypothetical protein